MKPKITYTCTNENCAKHAKEIELHYSSFFGSLKEKYGEDYWTAKLKHCSSCYKTGKVEIERGTRKFSEIEAFEEYVLGVAKEAKLLMKLVERDVAEPEERKQFDGAMDILHDAKCPCCGQPLIETIEGEHDAKPSSANQTSNLPT